MRPYPDEHPDDVNLTQSATSVNRWSRLLPVPPDFFPGHSSAVPFVPLFDGRDKVREGQNTEPWRIRD